MMVSKPPKNALYLLPNAFTTSALFFGFYAILQGIAGQWQEAALGVLTAAVLDACDGRVARWTNTESRFGIEYDSLADAVAFGAAPAVLFYQWQLKNLGELGLAISFFLLCCHFVASSTLQLPSWQSR